MAEYEDIMDRMDRIEEKVEFASAEIFQHRGIILGRYLGILFGVLFALVIISVIGL